MVNKTPLRLVAIDGFAEDDGEAAPMVEVREQDAITRRVPNPVVDSETIPATPAPALVPMGSHGQGKVSKGSQGTSFNAATAVFVNAVSQQPQAVKSGATWKILAGVGVAVAIFAVVGASLALRKGAPVASPTVATPQRVETPMPPAKPAESVAAVAPVAAKAHPETIRLQVTVDPVEAKLSLDGNVVAGHILNLAVPRDQGIHVLSAAASGYIPFNQQVSFDSDVELKISLRRGASSSSSSRHSSRSRSVVVEAKSRVESPRPVAAPAAKAGPGYEPGMNLEMPAARPSGAKAIDERNPYKP